MKWMEGWKSEIDIGRGRSRVGRPKIGRNYGYEICMVTVQREGERERVVREDNGTERVRPIQPKFDLVNRILMATKNQNQMRSMPIVVLSRFGITVFIGYYVN